MKSVIFYVDLSEEDIDRSQQVSKLLSVAAAEHYDTTTNEGVFSMND